MISLEQITQLYAEKLIETNDHQAAFLKAVWVAYKQGVQDGYVGLPQTTEPGKTVGGPARSLDRELGAEELHPTVRPELSAVGVVTGDESYTSDVSGSNGVFGRATQCGPHYPADPPSRVRSDSGS